MSLIMRKKVGKKAYQPYQALRIISGSKTQKLSCIVIYPLEGREDIKGKYTSNEIFFL